MANTEQDSIESFNSQGVSAPLPGDNSSFDPPHELQAEVPVQAAPEVPAEGEGPNDPREVIEQFVGDLDKSEKKRTYAELRKSAEQETARKLAEADAILRERQGLAELADLAETNPVFRQRLVDAYNETVQGAEGAPTPYSPPARQPQAPQGNEEIARLNQRLGETERTLMKHSIQAATSIVQGRHQLNQEDMAAVVVTAVQNGFLKPGMSQTEVEAQLENARKIAFFERQKTVGKNDLLSRVAEKNRAVTAQGAAGEGIPRKPYDTTGKTFAEIRRDAKLAGSKGL